MDKRPWTKSSPELVERFDACLPKAAAVERRQMFGYPCAVVNGHMFTGLHEQRLVLRLDEKLRAELTRQAGIGPFVVMGRTMREYVAVERPLEHAVDEIQGWMEAALAHASRLPPKESVRRKSSGSKATAKQPVAKRALAKKAKRGSAKKAVSKANATKRSG